MQEISARKIHEDNSSLKIYLFNVGQGDHILLKFPTGEYGLIDFYYSSGYLFPEPPVLSYFKELKETLSEHEFNKITISFFCISHTDKDHVKGISKTIEWFNDSGLFIRNFWLGAARDESQLVDFLNEKVPGLIKNMKKSERLLYNSSIEAYNSEAYKFFKYFGKWKEKKFKNNRYQSESTGHGEYLSGIRSLDNPNKDSRALNMGPLTSHLDNYYNNLTVDILKKFLGVEAEDTVDKNQLSHILRIIYGGKNLLFGGDTDLEVWEDCLKEYSREGTDFVRQYGDYKANFIKVSHHGSKNSSSPDLWEKLIPKEGPVFLGISAGQHQRFKHPHSDTFTHLRQVRSDINILATNVCERCLLKDESYPKEWHSWYDGYIQFNRHYKKPEKNKKDAIIGKSVQLTTVKSKHDQAPEDTGGLLAYIFEIPQDTDTPITIRIAIAKSIRKNKCFYGDHEEKLNPQCRFRDSTNT